MIPHANIEQVSIYEDQFLFTTEVPGGDTLLYHGVVQNKKLAHPENEDDAQQTE